jgi:hypothetical protein
MSTLLQDTVTGPQGTFQVSTIRTFAGGAPDFQPRTSPFKVSDYASEMPWPYETMVFPEEGSTGLYHAAYPTEELARQGHTQVLDFARRGLLEIGKGVHGVFGTPSLTAEEWRSQQEQPNA